LNGSALTVYQSSIFGELYEGAYTSPDPTHRLRAFHQFLDGFVIFGLSDAVMHTFAKTRGRLRQDGKLIADMDLLIAATAVTYDLTLLTRNLRHFERIPDLKIYQPS
jgi:tRNA(fMet)-specific endonuclease VapC